MGIDFTALMAKKTDEELITLLTVRQEEYTETALDAAQAEFNKRNIDPAKLQMVKQEQTVIKEHETTRANEPLESDIKTLAMILPFIATMMHSKKFREGGYDRKLSELSNAAFYGRLILIGIVVVLAILLNA
jgi:hypothetical protein